MSTVQSAVEDALNGLREGFQADGADLQVEAVSDESVTVRLIGGEETCWECILPSEQLRDVIGSVLESSFPTIREIDLIDPRQS